MTGWIDFVYNISRLQTKHFKLNYVMLILALCYFRRLISEHRHIQYPCHFQYDTVNSRYRALHATPSTQSFRTQDVREGGEALLGHCLWHNVATAPRGQQSTNRKGPLNGACSHNRVMIDLTSVRLTLGGNVVVTESWKGIENSPPEGLCQPLCYPILHNDVYLQSNLQVFMSYY